MQTRAHYKQYERIGHIAFVWPIRSGNSASPKLKPDTAGFTIGGNKANPQQKLLQSAPFSVKIDTSAGLT